MNLCELIHYYLVDNIESLWVVADNNESQWIVIPSHAHAIPAWLERRTPLIIGHSILLMLGACHEGYGSLLVYYQSTLY